MENSKIIEKQDSYDSKDKPLDKENLLTPSRFKSVFKKWRHALLLLYIPLHMIIFFHIEGIITTEYFAMYAPLDDLIPFAEVFIIPYVLWYPAMIGLGVYLMIVDVPVYIRYMLFIILGFFISMVICSIFPNGQDLRPTEFVRDNMFTDIVRGLYSTDTNTNVFPSMHVVGSIAVAVGVFKCEKLSNIYLRIFTIILTVLICGATVFLKQHSILDVYGGVALSALLYWILFSKKKLKKSNTN